MTSLPSGESTSFNLYQDILPLRGNLHRKKRGLGPGINRSLFSVKFDRAIEQLLLMRNLYSPVEIEELSIERRMD